MSFFRSFLVAIACFMLMLGGRFAYELRYADRTGYVSRGYSNWYDFDFGKKNYASGKLGISRTKKMGEPQLSLPPAGSEKYEKIASIVQETFNFDKDYKELQNTVEQNEGVVQYESASGLKGQRQIHLGIGVPPEKFDVFIENTQKIATLTQISVVKNDKTSEYQNLRARRATLEQARTALAEMRNLNATLNERLSLEARYNEVESQIQDLGVSLGEFDTQNEFYTVKLSMREIRTAAKPSTARMVWNSFSGALKWTLEVYFFLSLGLFAFAATIFISVILGKGFINLMKLGTKKVEG